MRDLTTIAPDKTDLDVKLKHNALAVANNEDAHARLMEERAELLAQAAKLKAESDAAWERTLAIVAPSNPVATEEMVIELPMTGPGPHKIEVNGQLVGSYEFAVTP